MLLMVVLPNFGDDGGGFSRVLYYIGCGRGLQRSDCGHGFLEIVFCDCCRSSIVELMLFSGCSGIG